MRYGFESVIDTMFSVSWRLCVYVHFNILMKSFSYAGKMLTTTSHGHIILIVSTVHILLVSNMADISATSKILVYVFANFFYLSKPQTLKKYICSHGENTLVNSMKLACEVITCKCTCPCQLSLELFTLYFNFFYSLFRII